MRRKEPERGAAGGEHAAVEGQPQCSHDTYVNRTSGSSDKRGLAVQCCSVDGVTGSRLAPDNCTQGVDYATALAICEAASMRLCTDAEVLSEIGGYTGCGFDNKNVWTSTPWDQVPQADRA